MVGPGRAELAAAMGASSVVVALVLGQDRPQMPFAEDEQIPPDPIRHLHAPQGCLVSCLPLIKGEGNLYDREPSLDRQPHYLLDLGHRAARPHAESNRVTTDRWKEGGHGW